MQYYTLVNICCLYRRRYNNIIIQIDFFWFFYKYIHTRTHTSVTYLQDTHVSYIFTIHTPTHHYAPDQQMGSVKRDWCIQHLRFCFSRNSKFLCAGVCGLQLTFKGTKFKC